MRLKSGFRIVAFYRAFACGFGMFHEVFLNYNFYRLLEGDYPQWLKAGVCCLVAGVTGFLGLGLIDGAVDVLKGTLHYLPLRILKRVWRSKNKNFDALLEKMLELKEKRLSDFGSAYLFTSMGEKE